jgi:hypothetical protein
MKEWFKSKGWNDNKGLLIGLILLGIVLPVYIYLISFMDWGFDLTDKGTIGDAIGGITAPIIGIIGAMLVYLSFRSQVRANQLLSNQNEFRLLTDLLNELKKDAFFINEGKNWGTDSRATPYLAYLKKSDIKTVPSVFKRKLMFVFNDYIFLSERINGSMRLEKRDKEALINTMENIYDCYLDNYCKIYGKIILIGKRNAQLSESLKTLALSVIRINEERKTPTLDDEELNND